MKYQSGWWNIRRLFAQDSSGARRKHLRQRIASIEVLEQRLMLVGPFFAESAELFAATPEDLIANGSTWKYLDDGSNQGTAWTAPGFDDSGWAAGPAQLGYGDGDESTVVNFGSNPNDKFVTTYFRHEFIVGNAGVSALELSLLRDDGAAVYLNGVEILRDGLNPNAPFDELATQVIFDAGEVTPVTVSIPMASLPPGLLQIGANTLAVEIHQTELDSSDISFDMSLSAISDPLTLSVSFNNPVDVSTLAASDLSIDGTAATGFSLLGPTTVQFTIPSLSTGTHSAQIAADTVRDVDQTAVDPFNQSYLVAAASQYEVNQSPRLQLGDAPLDGFAGSETDQVELLWQTKPGGTGTDDRFTIESRLAGAENAWNTGGGISQLDTGTDGRVIHSTEIDGLNYNTAYEYRVRQLQGDVIVATYQNTFRTRLPVGDDTAFSFVAYGDSADLANLQGFRSVQGRINQVDPAFAVLLGDNVYEDGSHAESDARFDAVLNPEASLWTAGQIDYVGFGNHDVRTGEGGPSEQNYSVPIPVTGATASAAPPNSEIPEHNYSFDYGNVHFATFDTNSLADPGRLDGQLEWLEADLASSQAQWKIVYGHHPVAGVPDKPESPSDNYYQQVVSRLRAAGVDLFLTGHSHTYSRTFPLLGEINGEASFVADLDNDYAKGAGLIQVVAGTGGKSLRSGDYDQFDFVAVGFTLDTNLVVEYGFSQIDVTATNLTVSYVAADDGAILDSFTLTDVPDLTAPSGHLALPLDNGSVDQNPADDAVMVEAFQAAFEIQFTDIGDGIDDATVTAATVSLSRDGLPLAELVDYIFSYNTTANRATFTPVGGTFTAGAYQLVVNGSTAKVADLAGNQMSTTLLTIDITGSGGSTDPFEPNDSFAQAADLGTGNQTHSGLEIHESNNEDFYRWTANQTGDVTFDVLFDHSYGDVDVNVLSADQTVIASALSATDNESITLNLASGEVIYLQVYGYNGATHPDYDLVITNGTPGSAGDAFEPNDSFAQAADLGTGSQTHNGLEIHESNNDDFYRWTANHTGEVTFDVLFDHSYGDVDVNVLSADETVIARALSATDNESITLNVISNEVIYLQVYGYNGATHPDYDLVITTDTPAVAPDAFEPNDSFAQETDLGSGDQTQSGLTIHEANNQDFYRWTANQTGEVTFDVLFTHSAGDINLNVLDANQTIVGSSTTVTDNESVTLNVTSGAIYSLQIFGSGGATHPDYDLVITNGAPASTPDAFEPNDSFAQAADLGSGNQTQSGLTIHEANNQDFYRWTANQTGEVTFDVLFAHSAGDINLNVLDASQTIVGSSTTVTDNESVTLNVTSGAVYSLQIFGSGGATHPDYDLVIIGPTGQSAPTAINDDYSVNQDSVLSVPAPGVLFNDSDADGDALTAVLVTGVSNGTISLDANGAFTYTPSSGYFGSDSFTYQADDGTTRSTTATASIVVHQVVPPSSRTFFVVDSSADDTFEYDADGTLAESHTLGSGNNAPRGVAASPDGSTLWVIDSDDFIYRYDTNGNPLGSWKANGLSQPEGIATDGNHIWIVDRDTDRVYFFSGAAGHSSGNFDADSSFALDRRNRNPRGITTDGTNFWVVNPASSSDRVYKYTIDGVFLGRWTLDGLNSGPSGITIDPSNVSDLWIVDRAKDQVFQYFGGTGHTSGTHNADAVFDLAAGNSNPRGIADPPPSSLPPDVSPVTEALSASATPVDGLSGSAAAIGLAWTGESGGYPPLDGAGSGGSRIGQRVRVQIWLDFDAEDVARRFPDNQAGGNRADGSMPESISADDERPRTETIDPQSTHQRALSGDGVDAMFGDWLSLFAQLDQSPVIRGTLNP